MRERVALYGGALDATPLPVSGFRVHARFPLSGLVARFPVNATSQGRDRLARDSLVIVSRKRGFESRPIRSIKQAGIRARAAKRLAPQLIR
jgi:hypothetical protein